MVNNNTYTLNKVNGNLNGDLLYSVIIFDEGDLAQCQVKLYGANSDDEVAGDDNLFDDIDIPTKNNN